MSKIRELLEIINRQNMVPDDFRYFEYERKLLNKIHAVVPELRALMAERDALRERLTNAIHYISEQRQYYTKSSADYYRKDYMDASYQDEKSEEVNKLLDQLQSILNATPAGEDLRVSEGERG